MFFLLNLRQLTNIANPYEDIRQTVAYDIVFPSFRKGFNCNQHIW